MLYDLTIIGGGPAGTAGAVYAARKQLKTIIIGGSFEGQSTVSPEIYNWVGTPVISGADLSRSLEAHVTSYQGEFLNVTKNDYANSVERDENNIFTVRTRNGSEIQTTSILVASGSSRMKLTIPGADTFEHKGITYCATCDGPLFSGQDIVVIGGGNAGFESALQLSEYTRSVTLLHRRNEFKADSITQEVAKKTPRIKLVPNVEPIEVHGEQFVSGISYKHKDTQEITHLPCSGIFVEIGSIPNTTYLGDLVSKTKSGHIIVDPRTQATSIEGIWAAGDCTDGLYHQNNIAAGDAVKAVENLYQWVKKNI
jgi:alkyl hydroperoxide reductase subunit F